ncbi:MAG: VWA domain-containing protein [Gammaproteobacteria bacterium]|nr:VWA domain-containing protein [Gammaproteobacteria bacterium]
MAEIFQDFHFLRPWWLLAAVPAVWLGVRWARRRTAASHWEEAVEPELLPVLLEPARNAAGHRLGWLLALGLLVGATGLAGPTWQRLPQPVEQKNDALVILFDLSLSMYAEDLSPSRLVRAKHKIADVLRRRDEGFTALVAYAGDAHTVAPLTDDTRTIENLLNALGPEMMPVFGSHPGAAMELAHKLFENAYMDQGRILLVTDGIDRLAEVTDFSNLNFPVSVLGIGTPEGAPISLDFANQPGSLLKNQQGETVHARLDRERLDAAARLCHGRYRTIALGDADIDHLLAAPLPRDNATIEVEREFDTWSDAGFWAALALLPLLLLGFRRGLLACLALTLLPLPAEAGFWDDLWQRRDQQALEALEQGDPARAAELFRDDSWRNAADYRNENYGRAAEGWAARAKAEPADSHYNLGNALARLGDFEAAIAAYGRALTADPGNEDAAFNKSLLEQLQQQRQQASDQDNREQQNDGASNPENSRQPQGGASDEQQPDEQQESSAQQPNEGEQQQAQDEQSQEGTQAQQMQAREDDATRDEQREALEQWLRRVPDDPGGLLRRKFEYETNLRARRGEQPQPGKIW